MDRTVRVLGLPRPAAWTVVGLPDDPEGRDRAVLARVHAHAAGRGLERVEAPGADLVYVARPAGRIRPGASAGPEVHVVTASGPDAGRVAPVPAGGLSIGRGSSGLLLGDPAAPSRPVRLRLTATGMAVDGAGADLPRFWDGRSALRLGVTDLEVLRGPQPALPPPSDVPDPVVDLGSAPGDHSLIVPLLLAGAPLVVGVVLALSTGSPLFLLFSLVSALAAGTTAALHVRARRRHRRVLAARAREVAAARRAAAVGPAEVSRAVRSRGPDRFGLLGSASPTAPVLFWGEGDGTLVLSRAEADERWSPAVRVSQPALTTPVPGRATRLAGPPRAASATARWAFFQLLRHAVATGAPLQEHTGDDPRLWWPGTAAGSPPPLVVRTGTPALFEDAYRTWCAETGIGAPGGLPPGREGHEPVVVHLGGPGTSEGPDTVDAAAGTVFTHEDGRTVSGVVLHGLSPATLEWWLAELADEVSRLGLLPGGAGARRLRLPEEVGCSSARDRLRTVLVPDCLDGAGAGEPLELDLVEDGPHLLIAGTTGSGKSDLLLSLLVGLAAGHPPGELALILLDFKGGASFGVLTGLPHTMSAETNHVGAASLRALQAIRAELRRREALFAAAGVPDYPTFRRRRPEAVLPRLVVAVDELRVLVDEHPDAAAVLQHLAATGRSLGFHLLLATQRATGAVSSDVRSNLGATIALRTATEQESWDLIGSGAAHRLDASAPGSAILSRPGRPDVRFRAAPWGVAAHEPAWRPLGAPPPPRSRGSDWPAVTALLGERYAAGSWPLPEPVVSAALPERWTPETGPACVAGALALLDVTARARHEPWRWPAGSEGGAAWIVEPAGGRTEVLRCVVETARREGPLLVLDGTGEVDAETIRESTGAGETSPVTVLTPDDDASAATALDALRALAVRGGTTLLTGWSGWAALRVAETYRSFEEEVHRWLGANAARTVRVAALGGRELATSRLLLHLPHRFYVPAGTSPEHRLVWPRLCPVEPVPGRAVHVSPTHPEPGIPAQLAFPMREDDAGPA